MTKTIRTTQEATYASHLELAAAARQALYFDSVSVGGGWYRLDLSRVDAAMRERLLAAGYTDNERWHGSNEDRWPVELHHPFNVACRKSLRNDRRIRLVVMPDGAIQLTDNGAPGPRYEDWHHWMHAVHGDAAYAMLPIRIHAAISDGQ